MTLQEINFWKRLEMFVENVQVNDMPSEEEKEMILNVCKREQESFTSLKQDVIEPICPSCKKDDALRFDGYRNVCGRCEIDE